MGQKKPNKQTYPYEGKFLSGMFNDTISINQFYFKGFFLARARNHYGNYCINEPQIQSCELYMDLLQFNYLKSLLDLCLPIYICKTSMRSEEFSPYLSKTIQLYSNFTCNCVNQSLCTLTNHYSIILFKKISATIYINFNTHCSGVGVTFSSVILLFLIKIHPTIIVSLQQMSIYLIVSIFMSVWRN